MARQLLATYTEVVTHVVCFDVEDDFVPDTAGVIALVADGGGAEVERAVAEYDLDGWAFAGSTPASQSVAELFV